MAFGCPILKMVTNGHQKWRVSPFQMYINIERKSPFRMDLLVMYINNGHQKKDKMDIKNGH